MFKKDRVLSLLDAALKEMNLSYKAVPWSSVFGMRNFLSHEYGDVDAEGIFNTIKTNIPELLQVSATIRQDLVSGKLDSFLSD